MTPGRVRDLLSVVEKVPSPVEAAVSLMSVPAEAKVVVAEGSYYGSSIRMTPAADCTGNLDLGCGSAIESGTPDRDCVNVTSISTWSAIWTWIVIWSGRRTCRETSGSSQCS